MDGDAMERQLVNLLDDLDWGVMRAPASGSATKRELPDVIAGKGRGTLIVGELKSAKGPFRVTEEKIDGLLFFAHKFGAIPVFIARPKFDKTFYVFEASRLDRTDSGNIYMSNDAGKEGVPIEDGWFDRLR